MRDPLHWMSVKRKLALAFAGLYLLAFGVGGALISFSARGALEDEIDARIEMECSATARALDERLRLLARRTQDFASDGFIRERTEALLRAGEDGDELRLALESHLRTNKLVLEEAFVGLTVVSPTGVPLVHVDEGPVPIPMALPTLDDERGLWHSDLLVSSAGGGPLQAISTPLLHLDGSCGVGRLVAWVDADGWVRSSLSKLRREERGSPTDVRIEDQAGRSLTLVADRGHRLEFDARPGATPPRPLGVRRRELSLDENDWKVHVQLHTAKAFEAVSGFQSRVFGVGVVLALLCAGLLFFPMRFLVRPLGVLLEAAKRIRAGDYTVRVDVEAEDEVGDLARSFNHMAESVELQTNKLKSAAEDLRVGQRELRTQHERLTTVIRSLRDGLVVVDPDGKPVLSNDAAKPLLAVLERADEQVTSHFLCREGAETKSCSNCLLRPEGPTARCVLDVGSRVFEVHGAELPPDATGRRGRVLVSRDITERVAQDEQDIHRERLSVLGEVAAVMAHELNNPLTSIRMFAQMMEDGLPEDSAYREHTGVIVRNTETCRQTIRELLGYATASAPEATPVDVHAVIEDVVRFVRPLAERGGADVEVHGDASDAVVHGDEVQIRQVLVNLVMNAVQGADGEPVRISITTHDEGGVLSVDVSDTGPGVPEELRERIFDAFFSTKPRGVGTGLGLPTARRIAELHGGGVDLIDGTPGQTTFRLRLRTYAGPGTVSEKTPEPGSVVS